MQNSVWKLTALSAVIGLGILVIHQAQTGLGERQAGNESGGNATADSGTGESGTGRSGGSGSSQEDEGNSEFLSGNWEPHSGEPGLLQDDPFRAGTGAGNGTSESTPPGASSDPFLAGTQINVEESGIQEFRPDSNRIEGSPFLLTSAEDEGVVETNRNLTNDASSQNRATGEPEMLPLLPDATESRTELNPAAGEPDRSLTDNPFNTALDSGLPAASPGLPSAENNRTAAGSSQPADAGARQRVQRMLATARRAIAAGDLDIAQELAEAASEIPVQYEALDDRPEEVLREINRQLGQRTTTDPENKATSNAIDTQSTGVEPLLLTGNEEEPDTSPDAPAGLPPVNEDLTSSPFESNAETEVAAPLIEQTEPAGRELPEATEATELVNPFATEEPTRDESRPSLPVEKSPGEPDEPNAGNQLPGTEPGLSTRDPLVPAAEPFEASTQENGLDLKSEPAASGKGRTGELPVSVNSEPEPSSANRTDLIDQPGTDAIPINDLSHKRPELTIEKVAPAEAVLEKDMVYSIVITNRGRTNATEVVVEDVVPKECELVGTIPQAELVDDKLIWKLGRLPAGEKKKILIKVVPKKPGEIGSVATVSFASEVSSKTSVRPGKSPLKISVQSPEQAQVGEIVTMKFRIENTGSADVTGLSVQDLIPDGFEHPAGDDLTYDVGTLAAGDVLDDVELELKAVKAGEQINRIILKADGGIRTELKTPVKLIEKGLQVQVDPVPGVLVGQTVNQVTKIVNRSAADGMQVAVISRLPAELAFVKASADGRYDSNAHAVVWNIDRVPGGTTVSLTTTVQAKTFGNHATLIQVTEPGRQPLQARAVIESRGIAVLAIGLDNVPPTVKAGEEFTIDARIVNRGTGPDSKVQLTLDLPQELEFVNSRGPVRMAATAVELVGGPAKRPLIQSAVIPEIGERASVDFQIFLRARASGRPRLRAKVSSAQQGEPISTEAAIVILNADP